MPSEGKTPFRRHCRVCVPRRACSSRMPTHGRNLPAAAPDSARRQV
ncbi:hypothetical protein [Neisseria uirgultaei]|nr:hypothetical protein [Neisseria uirgultaei]